LVKDSPADLRLLKMKHPVLSHQSRMVWVCQICPMAQLLLASHCWGEGKRWLVQHAPSHELSVTHLVWALPKSCNHKSLLLIPPPDLQSGTWTCRLTLHS